MPRLVISRNVMATLTLLLTPCASTSKFRGFVGWREENKSKYGALWFTVLRIDGGSWTHFRRARSPWRLPCGKQNKTSFFHVKWGDGLSDEPGPPSTARVESRQAVEPGNSKQ